MKKSFIPTSASILPNPSFSQVSWCSSQITILHRWHHYC